MTLVPRRSSLGEIGGRVPTIHLADPDPSYRASLAHALRRRGIQVEEFASGVELYASAVMCAPDLVVLEIDLAEMDGFEVFDRLRLRDNRRVPVVFLTAFENAGVARSCLERGALAYLEKGRALEDLVLNVERCLARACHPAFELDELLRVAGHVDQEASRRASLERRRWRQASARASRLRRAIAMRRTLGARALAVRSLPSALAAGARSAFAQRAILLRWSQLRLSRARSATARRVVRLRLATDIALSRARVELQRHVVLLGAFLERSLSRARVALGRQASAARSAGRLALSLARLEGARRATSARSSLELSLERARRASNEQLLLLLRLSGHRLARMELAMAAGADRLGPRLKQATEALRIRGTRIESRFRAEIVRAGFLLDRLGLLIERAGRPVGRAAEEAAALAKRLAGMPALPPGARRALPVVGLLGLLAAQVLVSGRSPRAPSGAPNAGLSPVATVRPDGPGSSAGTSAPEVARGAALPDAGIAQVSPDDAGKAPAPKPARTAKRKAGHRSPRIAPAEQVASRPPAPVEPEPTTEAVSPPKARISQTPIARPEAPAWLRGPTRAQTSRVRLETTSGRLDLILARDEQAVPGGRAPSRVTLDVVVASE